MRHFYYRPLEDGNDHPRFFRAERNFNVGPGESCMLIMERENVIEQLKRRCGSQINMNRRQRCVMITNRSSNVMHIKKHSTLFNLFQSTLLEVRFINALIASLYVLY